MAIARLNGRVAFAKLEVLTDAQGVAAASPVKAGRSTTIPLDDFERANPLSAYQVWRGDDSAVDRGVPI